MTNQHNIPRAAAAGGLLGATAGSGAGALVTALAVAGNSGGGSSLAALATGTAAYFHDEKWCTYMNELGLFVDMCVGNSDISDTEEA